MKSIIKICNMESGKDVNKIHQSISNSDGIMAIEISLRKKEITVIHNESFISNEQIINIIEDLGYIVN